jgi:hypothetical protein
MNGRLIRFVKEHINKVEQARNRLALYYNCYLEVISGGLGALAFLDIVINNIEKESSYTCMKLLLKLSHQILRMGLDSNTEFEYSEILMNLAVKMIGQGKFPNLLYKYIALFAYMPFHLELLENILFEKQMSLARFYRLINPKYKMYMATRLNSCEGISADRKEKIFNCFLEKCPIPILIEHSKLCFLACSYDEKEKKEVWEYFVNEANHSEKNFVNLKCAMKCFIQQGQNKQNNYFSERFFADLPHVASLFDRKYIKVFLKYLGPRDKLKEENEKWLTSSLQKIDKNESPEAFFYLNVFSQLKKRLKDSLKVCTSLEVSHEKSKHEDSLGL